MPVPGLLQHWCSPYLEVDPVVALPGTSLLTMGCKPRARSSGQQKLSHFLSFSHLHDTAGCHVSDKEAAKLPATHYLLLVNHFLAL